MTSLWEFFYLTLRILTFQINHSFTQAHLPFLGAFLKIVRVYRRSVILKCSQGFDSGKECLALCFIECAKVWVALYSSKDGEDGLTRYLGELQSMRRCYTALQTNLLLEAIASMLRLSESRALAIVYRDEMERRI